ncbi:MAG TPA: hypothetical protein VMZ30_10605 [Pyrinomonadaceae bacterium]|nr:hypothetical protein [Pyrinomonadaceae bacterium]
MTPPLEDIKNLYSAGRYDDALRIIRGAEKECFASPALLVWKARCLLLTDNPTGTMDDVQRSLEQALKVDNEYLAALVDLAYFHLNVMDNPQAALPMFRRALSLFTQIATETIVGLGEAISETDSSESALEFLESNADIKIDASKLQELTMELKSAKIKSSE